MPSGDTVTCALCGGSSSFDDENLSTLCLECRTRDLHWPLGRLIIESFPSLGNSAVEVERNAREFSRQMTGLRQSVRRSTVEALNREAQSEINMARERTPVDTGALVRSIRASEGLISPSVTLEDRIRRSANLPPVAPGALARIDAGETIDVGMPVAVGGDGRVHPLLPGQRPIGIAQTNAASGEMVDVTMMGDSALTITGVGVERYLTGARERYCPECHELLNLNGEQELYHCPGCGLDVTASELSAGRHVMSRSCPRCSDGRDYMTVYVGPNGPSFDCSDCGTTWTQEFLDEIQVHLQGHRHPAAASETRGHLAVAGERVGVSLSSEDLDSMAQTLADEHVDVPALVTYYGSARILTELSTRIQEFEEDRRQTAAAETERAEAERRERADAEQENFGAEILSSIRDNVTADQITARRLTRALGDHPAFESAPPIGGVDLTPVAEDRRSTNIRCRNDCGLLWYSHNYGLYTCDICGERETTYEQIQRIEGPLIRPETANEARRRELARSIEASNRLATPDHHWTNRPTPPPPDLRTRRLRTRRD